MGMEILWTFLSGIFSGVWPEMAVIGWHEIGWTQTQTLLAVLIASGSVLLISYGLLNGIFWKSSKILSKRADNPIEEPNRVMRFLLEQYSQWGSTKIKIQEKMGGKIAGYLSKHKYIVLLIFNLIPFIPVITTATIVAARLAKAKYGIIPIFFGSVIKISLFVWLVYVI